MKSSKSTSKSMVSTSSTLFYVYGLAPDCARVQNHREYPISMLEMQMEHFFFCLFVFVVVGKTLHCHMGIKAGLIFVK